ncbi:MAG: lipid II flippase MurJ [Pseudomonadota bacterium]
MLLLSRISGLVREQVIGARLGLNQEADVVLFLLTLPDILVGVLLSGGFGAALIPVLSKADKQSRIVLMRRMVKWTLLFAVILVAILWAGQNIVVSLIVPSLDIAAVQHLSIGYGLSLVAVLIAAGIGVCSAYLNVTGHYSLPALSVLVFNGVIILYFGFGIGVSGINLITFGGVLIVANMLRLAVQMNRMTEVLSKVSVTASFPKGFLLNFAQGVFAFSLIVAMPMLFRSLYATAGPGALAEFNYALRLFELPMGVLISIIPILFLPLLSRLDGAKDPAFKQTLLLALELALGLGMIAAVLMGLFSLPIVTVLFGYGALSGDGVDKISKAVQILIIGLPFQAMFQALAAGLNATNRTQFVLLITCGSFVGSVVLYLALTSMGFDPKLAAMFGFVVFHVCAFLAAFWTTLGAGAVRFLPKMLILSAQISILAVLCAWLNPWLQDGTIQLRDVGFVLLLAVLLLFTMRRLIKQLATLRDTVQEE